MLNSLLSVLTDCAGVLSRVAVRERAQAGLLQPAPPSSRPPGRPSPDPSSPTIPARLACRSSCHASCLTLTSTRPVDLKPCLQSPAACPRAESVHPGATRHGPRWPHSLPGHAEVKRAQPHTSPPDSSDRDIFPRSNSTPTCGHYSATTIDAFDAVPTDTTPCTPVPASECPTGRRPPPRGSRG